MITCLLAVSVLGGKSQAQDLLSNVYGRDYQLLNGKWGVIVDLYDQGERMQVYKNNLRTTSNFMNTLSTEVWS